MKLLFEDILKKTQQKINLLLAPISYARSEIAYLIAVWGSHQSNDGWKAQNWGAQVSLFKSAHHVTAKSAAVYIKDAGTLYELVTHEKHTGRRQVSDWAPIHMEQIVGRTSSLIITQWITHVRG
jgi:hypothetical protein